MIFHWMAKNNTKCVCGGADAGKEWLVVMDKVIRHVTKCYKEKKRDTALNRKRACVCTKKKKKTMPIYYLEFMRPRDSTC